MRPLFKNIHDHEDLFFAEMEAYAKENFIPIIRRDAAIELLKIVCERKPTRILEIGTAIGYSSLRIAHALNKKVFIQTVEILSERVLLARENIRKFGYEDCIQVVFGDGEDVMRSVESHYDMIFLDGSKSQNVVLLTLCEKLLTKKGFLVVDNILCGGFIDDDWLPRKKRTMVRKMQAFMKCLGKSKFETTYIPVADGLMLLTQK